MLDLRAPENPGLPMQRVSQVEVWPFGRGGEGINTTSPISDQSDIIYFYGFHNQIKIELNQKHPNLSAFMRLDRLEFCTNNISDSNLLITLACSWVTPESGRANYLPFFYLIQVYGWSISRPWITHDSYISTEHIGSRGIKLQTVKFPQLLPVDKALGLGTMVFHPTILLF